MSSGRWAIERSDSGRWGQGARVVNFSSERRRDEWVREKPDARQALGKRHPLVKADRKRREAEPSRHLLGWRDEA